MKKKILYVTRKEHFNAAHKLYNPHWTKEKNEEVFGKCANENWHGHNFDLFVTVKGSPSDDTGFVMNLQSLRDLIITKVTDVVDHKNLNMDVPFMEGKLASIENLAIGIWDQLEPHMKGCKLHCIKLFETHNNFVEYFGEESEVAV